MKTYSGRILALKSKQLCVMFYLLNVKFSLKLQKYLQKEKKGNMHNPSVLNMDLSFKKCTH
ncbi:hypothetical protein CGI99_24350 [Vibrio parahaemolyticus]|nr:hypothetical protein CGI99_24350 [Vibrio parahaemolyticus]